MWTSKVVSVAKQSGKITIRVAYSNGTESFEEEYTNTGSVNMDWLKREARERIAAFIQAYAFADTLTPDQAIDTTEPVVAPPTQAETDLQNFLADYRRWLSVRVAIDAQILTGSEPKVVELQNKVKAAFKPAYLQYL